MSTITKTFEYKRSENYGGGDIKAAATYQSTADWVTVTIERKDHPEYSFGLPLEEWQYMFDLINESLTPKGQSIT